MVFFNFFWSKKNMLKPEKGIEENSKWSFVTHRLVAYFPLIPLIMIQQVSCRWWLPKTCCIGKTWSTSGGARRWHRGYNHTRYLYTLFSAADEWTNVRTEMIQEVLPWIEFVAFAFFYFFYFQLPPYVCFCCALWNTRKSF